MAWRAQIMVERDVTFFRIIIIIIIIIISSSSSSSSSNCLLFRFWNDENWLTNKI